MAGPNYAILFVVAALFVLFLGVAVAAVANAEQRRPGDSAAVSKCPRGACGCDNPTDARYCRRCGAVLAKDAVA